MNINFLKTTMKQNNQKHYYIKHCQCFECSLLKSKGTHVYIYTKNLTTNKQELTPITGFHHQNEKPLP